MSYQKQLLRLSTRKRSKNYTEEEEILLVELIENHKHIIENKKSDSIVWKEKAEAWQTIAEDFAANMGVHRPWKNLREKYDMLKRKMRMEIAEQKLGVSSVKISASSSKLAAMLGNSATVSQKDCDSSDDCGYVEFFDEENGISQCNNGSTSQEINDLPSWEPTNLKRPNPEELAANAKRKKNLAEEKMNLVMLQQKFYKNEESRAQEKHEQELLTLKLKAQILQLQLDIKTLKSNC